jgi:hypothetical protein
MRARIVALARSLPPLLRAGFVVLAVGLALDVVYHVTSASSGHHHGGASGSGVPTAIHGVVAAGMALSLLGLVSAVAGRRRSVVALKGGSVGRPGRVAGSAR